MRRRKLVRFAAKGVQDFCSDSSQVIPVLCREGIWVEVGACMVSAKIAALVHTGSAGGSHESAGCCLCRRLGENAHVLPEIQAMGGSKMHQPRCRDTFAALNSS